MTLKERINDDMKAAMRARESARLGAIRLLMAAIKQKEIDERVTLDDTGIILVIDKMIKQRRDSISQYQAAGRTDLVDVEKFEMDVLNTYCPAPMTAEEVEKAIAEAMTQTGAKGVADMGKLMAVLKPALAGKADIAEVSKLVKQALSK